MTKTIAELRSAVGSASERGTALYDLGRALATRGESVEAVECLRRAADICPDGSDVHSALGRALLAVDQLEAAACCLERALALKPDHPTASHDLPWLYLQLARVEQARPLFTRAIALAPQKPYDYAGLCRTLLDGRQPADVARIAQKWLPPSWRPAALKGGLTLALMHVGRYDEARCESRERVHENPSDVEALIDLGRAELALGDRAAAFASYENAYRANPRNGHAIIEYCRCLHRFDRHERAPAVLASADARRAVFGTATSDAWVSAPLAGRTVLVQQPGGYGDIIHWSRFALSLKARGARIVFEAPVPLRSLVATMPGVDGVVCPYDEPVPFDHACRADQVSLLSDWRWSELDDQVPYFVLPAAARRRWSRTLPRHDGMRIGLVFRSGHQDHTEHDPYCCRSIPVEQLRRLTEQADASFYALCLRPSARRLLQDASPGVPIVPLDDDAGDFLESAAAMAALDLVVATDTAAAHLAGALGKECLLLLPYLPDWRWGLDTDRCRWYPSARLFRQSQPGDWASVLDAVAREIRMRLRPTLPANASCAPVADSATHL